MAQLVFGPGVLGLGEALDRIEPAIPLPGHLRHGLRGIVESVGVHPVQNLAALFAVARQTGLFEHGQMLGHGLASERNLSGQPARRHLTVANQQVEDATTRGVGNSRPQLVIVLCGHRVRPLHP